MHFYQCKDVFFENARILHLKRKSIFFLCNLTEFHCLFVSFLEVAYSAVMGMELKFFILKAN